MKRRAPDDNAFATIMWFAVAGVMLFGGGLLIGWVLGRVLGTLV